MLNVVKIISDNVEKGRRFLKFLRLGKNDVQTAYEAMPPGVDAVPIENMKAIYAKTGVNGKDVIIGYINTNQVANAGEHKIFATDAQGNEKRYIHLKDDNTIEFGGTGNFLVKYNELAFAFNQLKTEYNAHIAIFNSHIHPYIGLPVLVPGVTTPTITPSVPSTADISPAKINDFTTF